MTKVWQFYAQSARRNPTDLWISIATVLVTLVLGGVDARDEVDLCGGGVRVFLP